MSRPLRLLLTPTALVATFLLGCSGASAPPGDTEAVGEAPVHTASHLAQTDEIVADGSAGSSAPTRDDAAPAAHASPAEAAGDHPTKHPANRLAGETSPYLLMHAHNPVQWYPWGEEALNKAREEKKLIFLSIGYSSCYWCHVMERESFMNDDIASYLNEHFVCIKVDREERPDIDEIYMTSLQLYYRMIGSPQGGGWPLSMFLTPSGNPFFGGTYFPPEDKNGVRGFDRIIRIVQRSWENDSERIERDGAALTEVVSETLAQATEEAAEPLDESVIARAMEGLAAQFDAEYGGFGFSSNNPRRPKFPEPANLFLLLARAREADDTAARDMLLKTLSAMSMGGIWDHLGGGFHRYSTDRYWHVPHFEKMLYDNGQLATLYAETHALSGEEMFARVARGICDFVLAEMTGAHGAFYSAIDAETDAEEGKYYVWTEDELTAALDDSMRPLTDAVYGTGGPPNFEHKYVLLLRQPLASIAAERGVDEPTLLTQLAPLHEKLLSVRQTRERPLTDDKILASWNGLMIRGMADTGRILDAPEYVDAAARAARFVLDKMRDEDGRLKRSYREGQARLNAYLDDYAFFVNGLLALYQATGERSWIDLAAEVTQKQIELFGDTQQGGFYFTSHDHEQLIARGKKQTDGALPSGNSVAAENLLELAAILDSDELRRQATGTIEASRAVLAQAPAAAPRMVTALMRWLNDESMDQ